MVTNNSVNEPTAASGKVLQGQGVGTTSNFSTATYPSTATGTGKILRADGTNWVATTATYPDTAGTSGNVLTSDGTNWTSAAASSGAMVKLATTTASNQATVSFTSGITSTYSVYVVFLSNIIPIDAAPILSMQASTNGGSSYLNTNYQSGLNYIAYNSATWGNVNITTGFYVSSSSSGAAAGISGSLYLYGLPTTNYKFLIGSVNSSISAVNYCLQSNGVQTTSSAVNAIQFSFSTGNISSGVFSLYGIV